VEQTALVLAQRDGILLQVQANEGQRVAQGQVLARLNDDDERAQLRQAELEVQRLQLEEGQYKALVQVNRNELEREQQLAKEGITSKAQVEHAQYQLDASSGEYEKTRLATKAAQARVEAVKLEIAKSVVTAPRADVIGGAGLKPGLSVNVHIPRASAAASIWLPRSVFPIDSEPRAGASATLFVVDGDRCAARDVWINSTAGDQVEISSGLAAGER